MRRRRALALGLAVVALSLTAAAQGTGPAIYDVVIRNGHVLDGAGNPSIRADIAIKSGRFVRIGMVPGRGVQEIDATGKYGSPGWVDMMDQSGSTLVTNGLAENKLRAGVTSAIGGEGGTNVRFQGKTLTAIADEMGKDPADAAFDLVAQGQGRVMALYHVMSEPDIETALRFPWTSIGSDAGSASVPGQGDATGLPHPRAYGNFPRVIARYVRELKVLTLPDAVRKMTSWPATRMRLGDRGLIREGLWADVVVFDYEKTRDRATYEEPTLSPEGIDWVLVNGEVVIDHGTHTGKRPGKVLYGPGRAIAHPDRER